MVGYIQEDSLNKKTTLNKILEYVKEGGIFVNVADVPFFWAYNFNIKRREKIHKIIGIHLYLKN